MLARQGAKLPNDFDVTRLRQGDRTSETWNDTNGTRNERSQNNQDNKPRNDDNPLLALTQQIQALQTQPQDMQREMTKRY